MTHTFPGQGCAVELDLDVQMLRVIQEGGASMQLPLSHIHGGVLIPATGISSGVLSLRVQHADGTRQTVECPFSAQQSSGFEYLAQGVGAVRTASPNTTVAPPPPPTTATTQSGNRAKLVPVAVIVAALAVLGVGVQHRQNEAELTARQEAAQRLAAENAERARANAGTLTPQQQAARDARDAAAKAAAAREAAEKAAAEKAAAEKAAAEKAAAIAEAQAEALRQAEAQRAAEAAAQASARPSPRATQEPVLKLDGGSDTFSGG